MSTTLSAPGGVHTIARPARAWRLGAALKKWWAACQRRRRERLTIAHLRGMGDRELKDIGIVRSQIDFAVRHGDERYRRAGLGL
jgi:uncharacterized protein YjiS (DUF1127 family)